MTDVSLAQLRKLAIWPTIGAALGVIWLSIIGVVNKFWIDGFTSLATQALNIYVSLLLTCFMIWALARACRDYRSFSPAEGTFPYRYLRTSKVVALTLLILLVSFLFLAGFGVFIASFSGAMGSNDLIDRVVLTYVPVIIEAATIFYGVYHGFVSGKRGK